MPVERDYYSSNYRLHHRVVRFRKAIGTHLDSTWSSNVSKDPHLVTSPLRTCPSRAVTHLPERNSIQLLAARRCYSQSCSHPPSGSLDWSLLIERTLCFQEVVRNWVLVSFHFIKIPHSSSKVIIIIYN